MKKETLLAPVSGIISQVTAPNGAFVKVDELILSIEVMKLFYDVTAGLNGKINLSVQLGEFVQENQIIGEINEVG